MSKVPNVNSRGLKTERSLYIFIESKITDPIVCYVLKLPKYLSYKVH